MIKPKFNMGDIVIYKQVYHDIFVITGIDIHRRYDTEEEVVKEYTLYKISSICLFLTDKYIDDNGRQFVQLQEKELIEFDESTYYSALGDDLTGRRDSLGRWHQKVKSNMDDRLNDYHILRTKGN